MAAKALIAPEEYLTTSFDGPEPDYVAGELVERSAPNSYHAAVQVNLTDAFKPWQDKQKLFRMIEIRLRVAPDKYRIADLALFSSEPLEAIPESTPYAVVEIVSPDDRFEDLMSKLADYEEAGVEFIFVADPPLRKLSRYRHGNLFSAASLELGAHDVAIPLSSIFG